MEITSRRYRVNGVELHVLVAGSGKPVLLLHGFPDSAEVWRAQMLPLARAGYQVIAPDLRGCGLSEMPPAVRDYRLRHLCADVLALLDAMGIQDKVKLVGHDWGAVIGWQLAIRHSARFERYIALAVGHPTAYARAGWEQKRKGWYLAWFQLRGLCEWSLRRGNFAGLLAFTRCHHEMAIWRERLAPPGRLRSGLNWYRANMGLLWPGRQDAVTIPVVGIYAERDIALAEDQMRNSARYCTAGFQFHRLPALGHWMQSEAPEQFNPLLLQALGD